MFLYRKFCWGKAVDVQKIEFCDNVPVFDSGISLGMKISIFRDIFWGALSSLDRDKHQ
jgi:hypothetical protein